MPPKITGRDLNEHNESVAEFSEVLPPFFPPQTSSSVRVGVVVVVIDSCGGSDSGTYASPPSYPVFPFSLNVVNA